MKGTAPGALSAGALLLVLVFAPIAFGLVENWSAFTAFGAIFLIAMFWFPHRILAQRDLHEGTDPLPFKLFVALAALSLIYTVNLNLTMKHVLFLFACYLVFVMVSNLNASRQTTTVLLWSLAAVATALALYGLIMTLTGTPLVLNTLKQAYKHSVTATYVNKNHFAGFLEMNLFVTLGLLLAVAKKKLARIVLSIFIALQFTALLLTLSVGGVLSFAVALAIVSLTLLRERCGLVGLARGLLPIGLSVALAAVIGLGSLRDRMAALADSDENESVTERISLARSGLRIVADHWLLGTGAGTFQTIYPAYRRPELIGKADFAHDDYLETMIELGVPGFLILTLCIFVFFRNMLGWISKRKDRRAQILASALLGGNVSILLHSLYDFNLRIPANALYFAFLAGLAAYVANTSFSRGGAEPQPAFGTERIASRGRAGRAVWATLWFVLMGGLIVVSTRIIRADVFYQRGYHAFNALDWDRAAALYGEAIANDPVVATFHSRKGYCHLNRAKFDPDPDRKRRNLQRALQEFQAAEALNGLNGDYNLNQAWTYKFLGDRAAEKAQYEKMLKKDPNNAAYLYQFGSFLIHGGGEPDRGLELLKKACAIRPKLFGEKIHEMYQAVPEYAKLAPVVPQDHSQHFFFAGFLAVKGNLDGAEAEIDKALSMSGGNTHYLSDYSQLLRKKGWYAEALARLHSIPKEARTIDDVEGEAQCLAELGRWDSCFHVLDEAMSKQPRSEKLHIRYARLAERHGDLERAVSVLKGLVDGGSVSAEVHKELAEMLWESGRLSECIESMKAAISRDPDNDDYRLRLADFYVALKDYDTAQTELEAILERKGGADQTASLRLLEIFKSTGQQEKFDTLCRRIGETAPEESARLGCGKVAENRR